MSGPGLWGPSWMFRARVAFDVRGVTVGINEPSREALEGRYPGLSVNEALAKVLVDGWPPDQAALFDDTGGT